MWHHPRPKTLLENVCPRNVPDRFIKKNADVILMTSLRVKTWVLNNFTVGYAPALQLDQCEAWKCTLWGNE